MCHQAWWAHVDLVLFVQYPETLVVGRMSFRVLRIQNSFHLDSHSHMIQFGMKLSPIHILVLFLILLLTLLIKRLTRDLDQDLPRHSSTPTSS